MNMDNSSLRKRIASLKEGFAFEEAFPSRKYCQKGGLLPSKPDSIPQYMTQQKSRRHALDVRSVVFFFSLFFRCDHTARDNQLQAVLYAHLQKDNVLFGHKN